MKVPERTVKKLVLNENNAYEVKFTLLKKLSDIETPKNYTSCKSLTKRKQLLQCTAVNIKVYLRNLEEEKGFKFVFNKR